MLDCNLLLSDFFQSVDQTHVNKVVSKKIKNNTVFSELINEYGLIELLRRQHSVISNMSQIRVCLYDSENDQVYLISHIYRLLDSLKFLLGDYDTIISFSLVNKVCKILEPLFMQFIKENLQK